MITFGAGVAVLWLGVMCLIGIPVMGIAVEYEKPPTIARHAAMVAFWPITAIVFVAWGAYLCVTSPNPRSDR